MLVAYGGPNETHEIAFAGKNRLTQLEGSAITSTSKNGALVVNWAVTPARKVLRINDDLYVYLLGEELPVWRIPNFILNHTRS